jgi:hypothetical protein
VNILDAPRYKISDRKDILGRVFWALLSSDEIQRYPRGTPLNQINWEARQTIANILSTFPETE